MMTFQLTFEITVAKLICGCHHTLVLMTTAVARRSSGTLFLNDRFNVHRKERHTSLDTRFTRSSGRCKIIDLSEARPCPESVSSHPEIIQLQTVEPDTI